MASVGCNVRVSDQSFGGQRISSGYHGCEGVRAFRRTACGYEYDRLSDDVFQVIQALRLSRFVLVGFSMGGAIVLRYMRRHQGFGVCRLALLGAAAPRYTCCPGFPYGVPRSTVESLIALSQTDRPQQAQDFSRQLLACPHSDAIKDWFRDLALEASGIGTVKTAYALRDGMDADLEWAVPGYFLARKIRSCPMSWD
ncbi:MAG: alpha/beta fold hydrolase [Bianqueaceae bacterium]